MQRPDLGSRTPEEFWENVYGEASPKTSGKPSKILAHYAADRIPGRALDLGCAKGDARFVCARCGFEGEKAFGPLTSLEDVNAQAKALFVAGVECAAGA